MNAPDPSVQRPLAIGLSIFMVFWLSVGFIPLGAASITPVEQPQPSVSAKQMQWGAPTASKSEADSEDANRTGRSLGTSKMLDSSSAPEPGNLTQATRLVTAGMERQVAQIDPNERPSGPSDATLPEPSTPSHTSPSAALFAMLEREDVTPTAEQAAEIRAMDRLPNPTRSELTDVLDAYLGYSHVAQDLNLRTIRRQQVATQVAEVRAAQQRLLDETGDLKDTGITSEKPGIAGPTSHTSVPSVQISGVVSINLTMHDNTYGTNYALQIDVGGSDTYNNNAGGAGGTVFTPKAAALIDIGGSDEYNGKNGGGGRTGVGFLLDAGTADDNYTAGDEATNGGGLLGVGFLLDAGGDDEYNATDEGTNGGAKDGGVGFLLDLTGSDTYNATYKGTNGGGARSAVGFLLDAGKTDDTYEATNKGTNGGAWSVNYFAGEVPIPAKGFLMDRGGNDTYVAGSAGVNGGAQQGTLPEGVGPFPGSGLLFDTTGTDSYNDSSVTCTDCSIIPKGTVGAQVDVP